MAMTDFENTQPYYFGDIGCWSERTDVHKAASLGQAWRLQHLIEGGASVNVVAVDSMTPLHEACIHGQLQCARLLLDAGAQVDARNVDGNTPLCEACAVGSLDCVKLLLERGAKVNPSLTSRTASPLHEACMRGERFLCKSSALDVETSLSNGVKIRAGNSECVKLLIAEGASLEAYDLYRGTPLHVACNDQHANCAKELLNAGANVNAVRLHRTALHLAAKVAQVEMIETLMEFGANVYARDKHDKKAIDLATPGSPVASCLRSYEANPLNLQQLSRLAVRRKVGTRSLKVVGQLQIPKLIIGYLRYE
ncbi:ankyrin repeat and SOCS box protein 13-like isoform X1 [Stigmatopora argus]